MAEPDVFERRLRAALLRRVADGPTEFDALGFARTVAAKEPRRRGLRGLAGTLTWRGVAVSRVAWVLLVVAALLTAMVAGLLVGGAQRPAWEAIAWPTWSPASDADTALVDQMNEIWNTQDPTLVEAVFADELVFTVEGQVYGGLDGLRESLPTVTGTYDRVGDVRVTTDPVPGLWRLPAGSRFLAFVDNTTGEYRDVVLEVSEEDRIVVFYNDQHRPPGERARAGYTRVDFTEIAGLAKLTLAETDRADAVEMAGCEAPAGGSVYVFLHLRLDGAQLSLRDVAADSVEVRGGGGEPLMPISCQREPAFEPAAGTWDGWVGVAVPASAADRLSIVYRHVTDTPDGQGPEVDEALIPFDLPHP